MTSQTGPRPLPHAFICPLTRRPLREPMLAADGYTYEKAALEAWGASHGYDLSPKTLNRMQPVPAVANQVLARTMREFYAQSAPDFPTGHRDDWQGNLQCPIGHDTMARPVRLSDGFDYNAEEAVQILRHFRKSPIVGTPWSYQERLLAAASPPRLWADRAMQALAIELGEVCPGRGTFYGPAPVPVAAPVPAAAPVRGAVREADVVARALQNALAARDTWRIEQHLEPLRRLDAERAHALLLENYRELLPFFAVVAQRLLNLEAQLFTCKSVLLAGFSSPWEPWCEEVRGATLFLRYVQWLDERFADLDAAPAERFNWTLAQRFVQGRKVLLASDRQVANFIGASTTFISVGLAHLLFAVGRKATSESQEGTQDISLAYFMLLFGGFGLTVFAGVPALLHTLALAGNRLRVPLTQHWNGFNAAPAVWQRMQARPILRGLALAAIQGVHAGVTALSMRGLMGPWMSSGPQAALTGLVCGVTLMQLNNLFVEDVLHGAATVLRGIRRQTA